MTAVGGMFDNHFDANGGFSAAAHRVCVVNAQGHPLAILIAMDSIRRRLLLVLSGLQPHLCVIIGQWHNERVKPNRDFLKWLYGMGYCFAYAI